MIFVFGSNLAGRHGAGAAKYAHEVYGAEYGIGEGLTGQAYALPTKDKNLNTIPLEDLLVYAIRFCDYARNKPDEMFLLTPIGTGLAGHKMSDIRMLFKNAQLPSNVVLASTWITDDKGD